MVVDKIYLVHSITVPVPFQGLCPTTRFPYLRTALRLLHAFFSLPFYVILEWDFDGIAFAMLLFRWLDLSSRAAVAVVHKNQLHARGWS